MRACLSHWANISPISAESTDASTTTAAPSRLAEPEPTRTSSKGIRYTLKRNFAEFRYCATIAVLVLRCDHRHP